MMERYELELERRQCGDTASMWNDWWHSHLPTSQLRWRSPFKEWKANGAARMALPAYLMLWGRAAMVSMTLAEAECLRRGEVCERVSVEH